MTFVKNAIIKKPTARALCFAAGRAARGVRHRRMHLARTRVRLIPLLYRSACKWARGRPLWRVITPYRYKGRVSCHGGDEPVIVVIVVARSSSFFLSLSLSLSSLLFLLRREKRAVYRFCERPRKGQDVHGSLSLLSEDPIPSGGLPVLPSVISSSRARWIHPEVEIRASRGTRREVAGFILLRQSFRVCSSALCHSWLTSRVLKNCFLLSPYLRKNHAATRINVCWKHFMTSIKVQLKSFFIFVEKADVLFRKLHNYLHNLFCILYDVRRHLISHLWLPN